MICLDPNNSSSESPRGGPPFDDPGAESRGSRRAYLWIGDDVRVYDARWDASRPASWEDQAHWPALALVREGCYEITADRTIVNDMNTAIFAVTPRRYRINHAYVERTAVTGIVFSPRLADELARSLHCEYLATDQPTRLGSAPVSGKTMLLHQGMLEALRQRPRDGLLIEETVLRLIGSVVAPGSHGRADLSPIAADERIHAAKEFMAARYGERLSLGQVASASGWSAWYLSRNFHQRVGMPLHRYLNRVRLGHALDAICGGQADDLANLALRCGFCSHSHFTAVFRREFNIPPAKLRRMGPLRLIQRLAPVRG